MHPVIVQSVEKHFEGTIARFSEYYCFSKKKLKEKSENRMQTAANLKTHIPRCTQMLNGMVAHLVQHASTQTHTHKDKHARRNLTKWTGEVAYQ